MPKQGMTKEQIIARAKQIESGAYTGTKLYPVAAGRESAIKYLKKRKINPKEAFEDYEEVKETNNDINKKTIIKKEVSLPVKETPKEDRGQVDGFLSQIQKQSAAAFLNQVSAEERGNANYNPYQSYKMWFYRTYKPVIKPISKEEFETINVGVMEPSTSEH